MPAWGAAAAAAALCAEEAPAAGELRAGGVPVDLAAFFEELRRRIGGAETMWREGCEERAARGRHAGHVADGERAELSKEEQYLALCCNGSEPERVALGVLALIGDDGWAPARAAEASLPRVLAAAIPPECVAAALAATRARVVAALTADDDAVAARRLESEGALPQAAFERAGARALSPHELAGVATSLACALPALSRARGDAYARALLAACSIAARMRARTGDVVDAADAHVELAVLSGVRFGGSTTAARLVESIAVLLGVGALPRSASAGDRWPAAARAAAADALLACAERVGTGPGRRAARAAALARWAATAPPLASSAPRAWPGGSSK